MASLGASQAYLDGELCGVGPDGITSFGMIQIASDSGNAAALVFFLFDLLYLDGEDVSVRPLIGRKGRLAALLSQGSSHCTSAITTEDRAARSNEKGFVTATRASTH